MTFLKYLPWILVVLVGAALAWVLFAQPMGPNIGTISLGRIIDESPRAQELNQMLSDRYEELITQLNTEQDEETPEERAVREREAYSQYLAYRQELEVKLQKEVDEAVRNVAQDKNLRIVVDDDVVRYGGTDVSDEVIARLR